MDYQTNFVVFEDNEMKTNQHHAISCIKFEKIAFFQYPTNILFRDQVVDFSATRSQFHQHFIWA